MAVKYLPPALIAALMLGCATETVAPNSAWTTEQQAAYDQCLQDNMAVAMAWEMIEQSCREQVDGEDDPLELQ